eukprot:GILK01011196.1.p1 GENE.GILK01011196.1~~GILK01011196.1.p1  ORF type:complete len:380 (+),score=28.12 GILK01011196.1:58-1197(+)
MGAIISSRKVTAVQTFQGTTQGAQLNRTVSMEENYRRLEKRMNSSSTDASEVGSIQSTNIAFARSESVPVSPVTPRLSLQHSPSLPSPKSSPASKFRRLTCTIPTNKRLSFDKRIFPTLARQEADFLSLKTNLSTDEVSSLYPFFMSIANSQVADEVIDRSEWREAMSHLPEALANRLFRVFEPNRQTVSFARFVHGISVILSGSSFTLFEQCVQIFPAFDFNSSGFIEAGELEDLLRVCLNASSELLPQAPCPSISDSLLSDIVLRTIAEFDEDGDGRLSLNDFYSYAKKHPSFIRRISIDLILFRCAIGLRVADLNEPDPASPITPGPMSPSPTGKTAKLRTKNFNEYIDSVSSGRKSSILAAFLPSESNSKPVSLV